MDLPVTTAVKSSMIREAHMDGFKADFSVTFVFQDQSRPNSSYRGRLSAQFGRIGADLTYNMYLLEYRFTEVERS